jgi:hypothetical protein
MHFENKTKSIANTDRNETKTLTKLKHKLFQVEKNDVQRAKGMKK